MYSADEENTVVSFYKSLVSSYLTDSGSDSLGRGAIGWWEPEICCECNNLIIHRI